MDSIAFDSEQAGLLLAAYFLGYTLITTSAVFWLSRVNMRSAAWLSSFIFIAALLIGATQSAAALIYTGLFFAGVGAGMLYGFVTIIGQVMHQTNTLASRWLWRWCWGAGCCGADHHRAAVWVRRRIDRLCDFVTLLCDDSVDATSISAGNTGR